MKYNVRCIQIVLVLLLTNLVLTYAQEIGARYLIITHDNYYDALKPLAGWKTQKGLKAKIVRLSEIGSDSTQIRNYVINAYNTWQIRPEYLLLVGTKFQLPFPRFIDPSTSTASYSDNYYTNVAGDFHNEIIPGRFWVSDTLQAKTVVTKVLGYDKNPFALDSLWFKKGITIVNEYEEGQPSSESLYWADARYAHQLMNNAGFIHVDSFSYNLGDDSSDVINAINEGRSYILYRGIGFGDWLWPFGGVNLSQMANGFKMPIVLSATCGTIEGIGRDWLNAGTPEQPKGVVGFFGTTTALFEAAEMRSALARGTLESIFCDSYTTLGKAAEAGRLRYYQLFGDLIEYNSWTCLGDPEMTLWTSTPKNLMVGHNMYFTTGICTALVYVRHNLIPVESALVCVTAKADSTFYCYGRTDNAGSIRFIDTLHIPGDSVYITVTGHNLRPYHNARPVFYTGGPYLELYSFGLLDSLQGNGDSIANRGEDIEVPVCVKNWGDVTAYGVSARLEKISSDTFFTISDTIKYLGNILPLESVWVFPDGYNVIIDSNCPDLQRIDLRLNITDSNNATWTSDFGFTVHAPIIQYNEYYFPGQNKYTTAGDTNQLIVSLRNIGSYHAENIAGRIFCNDSFFVIIDSVTTFDIILPDSIGSNQSDPFIIAASSMSPLCYPVNITLEIMSDVHVDTFNFTVYVGQKDYLIWDPDLNHSSGPVINALLDSLNFYGEYNTDFPHGFLSLYKSLFVCAGVYPNKYVIRDTSQAGQEIAFYIQSQGGKVYLEGGDVWYDPLSVYGYNFGPLFGVSCPYNSIGLFLGVMGNNVTFTQNMSYRYQGEAIMIDYLDSTGSSALIFKNTHNNHGCGVAANNRTVGLSFELAGLVDTIAPSTKLTLVDSIMSYFGIPPTGVKESTGSAKISIINISCHPSPFRKSLNIMLDGLIGEKITMSIYDVQGRCVRTLCEESLIRTHKHNFTWDGTDHLGHSLPQGVYFIHLEARNEVTTIKTILLH